MLFEPINLVEVIKELAPLVTALGILITALLSWRASNRATLALAKIELSANKIETVILKTDEIKKQTDGMTTALVKITGEKERILGKIEGKAEEKAASAERTEAKEEMKKELEPKT